MPDGSLMPAALKSAARESRREAKPVGMPEVSLLDLAKALDQSRLRDHLLEIKASMVGGEEPQSDMDANRLAKRHIKNALDRESKLNAALENLILATRPASVTDVLIQLMVASSRVSRICEGDEVTRAEEVDRMDLVFDGALRVLAGAVGVSLASIGGRWYASVWCDSWPDVALTGDLDDKDGGSDACLDGSAVA